MATSNNSNEHQQRLKKNPPKYDFIFDTVDYSQEESKVQFNPNDQDTIQYRELPHISAQFAHNTSRQKLFSLGQLDMEYYQKCLVNLSRSLQKLLDKIRIYIGQKNNQWSLAEDTHVFIDQYLMPLIHLAHELLYIADPTTNAKLSFMSAVITQKPSDNVSDQISGTTKSILQQLRNLIFRHQFTSHVDDAVSLKNIYYILYLLLSRNEVFPYTLQYGSISVSPDLYVDPTVHKISSLCKRQFKIAYFQQVLEVIKTQRFTQGIEKHMKVCMLAKQHLEHYIGKIDKFSKYDWTLEFYGSTVSGLVSPNSSDVDITLMIAKKGNEEIAPVFHLEVLDTISSKLPFKRYQSLLMKMKRLSALRITDSKLNIKIDLCVNNILGIVNSQMIRTYCLMDRRYHELCLIMKMVHEELKPYGPQVTKKMTNYSFNLMILIFLQMKNVLPNILDPMDKNKTIEYEMQYIEKYAPPSLSKNKQQQSQLAKQSGANVFNQNFRYTFREGAFLIKFQTQIGMLKEFETKHLDQNTCTSELFLDFITFMKDFNCATNCFDVPQGRLTKKTEITRDIFMMNEIEDNDPSLHPYYIIDPFDVNHNPGKPIKFQQEMCKKYQEFFKTVDQDGRTGDLLKGVLENCINQL